MILLSLQVATALVVALAVAATGYPFVLAWIGLAVRRPPRPVLGAPKHRFALVIPAHDEELTLPGALRSCAELDYPAGLMRVFVVADNCGDNTAERAERAGATVLERHDASHRGKGYALAWAFERILPEGFDALVILDADCRLDRDALRVFDGYLARGDRVLQAGYVASNPDATAMSYAVAVANRVENDLFYAPKSRLGLAVLLRGTGMVFRTDLLRQYPWRACSIVEDAEYTLELLRAGIRVRFVPEVRVWSEFPQETAQLEVQRRRWAAGGLTLARTHGLRLIWEGCVGGQLRLIDAGWTLLILPRALVLGVGLLALALSLLGWWRAPGLIANRMLFVSVTVLILPLASFLMGALLLGLTRPRLLLLARTPAAIARYLLTACVDPFRRDASNWVRTPRVSTES
jgi:1,2-diacylglycerol 3-beta-glucosyltransferase